MSNGNIRQVTEQMLKEAEIKIRAVRGAWKHKYPPPEGKERPSLGILAVKMARCVCCFSSPERYNEDMQSVHGIETSLKDEFRRSPPAPQAPYNPHYPNDQILPILQAIKGNNEKYIALQPMGHRPGRRAVTEGLDDLIISLTQVGNYDSTAALQDKGYHKSILNRLKEMVHGNDMEDL